MGCDMGVSSRAGYFESQESSDGLGPDFEQRVITALKSPADRRYSVTSRELQESVNAAFNEGFDAGSSHARIALGAESDSGLGAIGAGAVAALGAIAGAAFTAIAVVAWHALFN